MSIRYNIKCETWQQCTYCNSSNFKMMRNSLKSKLCQIIRSNYLSQLIFCTSYVLPHLNLKLKELRSTSNY